MMRYFSSAGYILNKTRSSLDPNTMSMLVCLWDWWFGATVTSSHCDFFVLMAPGISTLNYLLTYLLTMKFQFSIHMNNFELTGDSFELINL